MATAVHGPVVTPSATRVLEIDSDGTVRLDDGRIITDSVYQRVGDDLVLRLPDGAAYVVRSYFDLAERPALMSDDGGQMTPGMVDVFTLNYVPEQLAQAGESPVIGAVATVAVLEGTATVTRADGTVEALTQDTQIFENDIVESGADGAVRLKFIDDTVFAIGPDARLAIDDFVFDTLGDDSVSAFSLVKGMFAFVSGRIADNDPTDFVLNTPVAVIGIRGSAGLGDVNEPGTPSLFTAEEPTLVVTNNAGRVVLDQRFATTSVSDINTPPSEPEIRGEDETKQIFSPLRGVVPDVLSGDGDDEGAGPNGPSDGVPDVNPEAGPGSGQGGGPPPSGGGTSQFTMMQPAGGADGGGTAGDHSPNGPGGTTGPERGGAGPTPGPTSTGNPAGETDNVLPPTSLPPPPSPPANLNLVGDAGDNLLVGGAGDDTLDGAGGNDTLIGEGGNDSVLGGPGDDSIVAGSGQGDDTYHGGDDADTLNYSSAIAGLIIDLVNGTTEGGAEIGSDVFDGVEHVIAGSGDDVFVYAPGYASLDGGPGFDSLIPPPGSTIDLTGESVPAMSNIEAVDLTDADADTLIIDGASLLAMVGPEGTLRVLGTGDDSVDAGSGWSAGAVQVIDDQTYQSYGQGGATLLVDTDIDRSGIAFVVSITDAQPVQEPLLGGGGGGGGGGGAGVPDIGLNGGTLISGLGGAAGFGENSFAANDDNSIFVDVTDVFGAGGMNFFGTSYTGFFLNNNGNITFDTAQGTFTPFAITGNTGVPIIAPYFADVDTTGSHANTPSPGGASTGSNLVYWDIDATDGVVTATWDDVGYYSAHTEQLNAFQLAIYKVGEEGDFAFEFRYENIDWTTGDASGGVGGLGGTVARAGWSAGDGANFFELPQSGDQAAMLALEATSNADTPQDGNWVFLAQGGGVEEPPGDEVALRFTVFLETGPHTEDVTVTLTPVDGPATETEDAATGGLDYDLQLYADAAGTMPLADNQATIPAGDVSVDVFVRVLADANVELPENLSLTVSDPVNAVIGDSTGVGTILDNPPPVEEFAVNNGGPVNDLLSGTDGDDSLVGGAGDDTLDGHAGADTMTGGNGADTFAWHGTVDLDVNADGLVDGVDQVTDFSGAGDGDRLDIADLLDGLGATAGTVADFFQTVLGGGTAVDMQVDLGGAGTDWQTFAQVTGADGLAGADLLDDVSNNIETGFV